jgi:RND family efflux transporter MFP subunit
VVVTRTVLALATLMAMLHGGCTKTAPAAARGVAVKLSTPEHAGNATATRYSAEIVPQTRVDLAFKLGGYVESIAQVAGDDGRTRTIQEGDRVIEGSEFAGLRRTDYAQKVAEARAGVAQAYSAFKHARLESSRDAQLVKSGSLAVSALDASRGQRDGAGAALAAAKARFDQAKTALDDTSLVAPMDGVVIKRACEVGALAAPGTVAFSIADVESVKAVFGVPDVLLPQIRLGATLKVTSDAFRGVEFEGKVTRLSPSADLKSHVFEVDVTIPNHDNRLKPGMVATLSIDAKVAAEAGASVLLIPLSAVIRAPSGKGFAVFVAEDTAGGIVARARPIELGDYLGRLVPVIKGLQGSERVVVLGAGLISDGERIEVIP